METIWKGFFINLTNSEKSTFIRFFILYLGSILVLMLFVAFFYYKNEKTLYFDLAKTKMQNVVSNISAQIIYAHMSGNNLNMKQFLKTNLYEISFYDKDKNIIEGNLHEKIDFSKNIIQNEKNFILIDNSTYGHLNTYYIAIKENLLYKQLENLRQKIVILFIFVYSLLSIVGFFLARLFLKPIKEERERLNNFIKDTTHELNTPISAILMSTEDDELSQTQIKRVKLAARKISEIYKDLTYIFLEDKLLESKHKEYNLKDLIISQLTYFEILAEKKRISIKLDLDNLNYEIDENDFIRLFNNLVSNAIKYNKHKGSINIALKDNILTITDTGIGIEENKVNNIFNRYYRATTLSGGFGIGLSIVHDVCQRYNIDIKVKSKINEGSTFTLTF